ncbi:MAG: ABC transporter ATP-binding protein [Planctomycetes bacterium]|nr:ABC transporter ATP-binding protein [Planctomycetota bacterium]
MALDTGHCDHGAPLLEVRDLATLFRTDEGDIRAVDGFSLAIERGRTVALVGESGCGKSATALSIMRLIAAPGRIIKGSIILNDRPDTPPVDLLRLDDRAMREIRGSRIAMVFQEPMTSLNPVFTVGEQIAEAFELHTELRGRAAMQAAIEMLVKVEIGAPQSRAAAYPHEISGGMRQRVMIAMALACGPSLLIADEATTALDVTLQMQVLDLLREVQRESGMSVLLITHDLGVVARWSDYVYVMYAGRVVEHAPVARLFAKPLHPYTRGLMACAPRLGERADRLQAIPGSPPDPRHLPSGCRFHPRCALCVERARDRERFTAAPEHATAVPLLRRCVERFPEEASGAPELRQCDNDHWVACWET